MLNKIYLSHIFFCLSLLYSQFAWSENTSTTTCHPEFFKTDETGKAIPLSSIETKILNSHPSLQGIYGLDPNITSEKDLLNHKQLSVDEQGQLVVQTDGPICPGENQKTGDMLICLERQAKENLETTKEFIKSLDQLSTQYPDLGIPLLASANLQTIWSTSESQLNQTQTALQRQLSSCKKTQSSSKKCQDLQTINENLRGINYLMKSFALNRDLVKQVKINNGVPNEIKLKLCENSKENRSPEIKSIVGILAECSDLEVSKNEAQQLCPYQFLMGTQLKASGATRDLFAVAKESYPQVIRSVAVMDFVDAFKKQWGENSLTQLGIPEECSPFISLIKGGGAHSQSPAPLKLRDPQAYLSQLAEAAAKAQSLSDQAQALDQLWCGDSEEDYYVNFAKYTEDQKTRAAMSAGKRVVGGLVRGKSGAAIAEDLYANCGEGTPLHSQKQLEINALNKELLSLYQSYPELAPGDLGYSAEQIQYRTDQLDDYLAHKKAGTETEWVVQKQDDLIFEQHRQIKAICSDDKFPFSWLVQNDQLQKRMNQLGFGFFEELRECAMDRINKNEEFAGQLQMLNNANCAATILMPAWGALGCNINSVALAANDVYQAHEDAQLSAACAFYSSLCNSDQLAEDLEKLDQAYANLKLETVFSALDFIELKHVWGLLPASLRQEILIRLSKGGKPFFDNLKALIKSYERPTADEILSIEMKYGLNRFAKVPKEKREILAHNIKIMEDLGYSTEIIEDVIDATCSPRIYYCEGLEKLTTTLMSTLSKRMELSLKDGKLPEFYFPGKNNQPQPGQYVFDLENQNPGSLFVITSVDSKSGKIMATDISKHNSSPQVIKKPSVEWQRGDSTLKGHLPDEISSVNINSSKTWNGDDDAYVRYNYGSASTQIDGKSVSFELPQGVLKVNQEIIVGGKKFTITEAPRPNYYASKSKGKMKDSKGQIFEFEVAPLVLDKKSTAKVTTRLGKKVDVNFYYSNSLPDTKAEEIINDVLTEIPLEAFEPGANVQIAPKDCNIPNQLVPDGGVGGHFIGDKTVVVYPTMTTENFRHILAHELGHNYSQEIFGNVTPPPEYINAINSDRDNISSYGNINPAEDFAEFFAEYAKSKGTPQETVLKTKWPNRVAYLEKTIGEQATRAGQGIDAYLLKLTEKAADEELTRLGIEIHELKHGGIAVTRIGHNMSQELEEKNQ